MTYTEFILKILEIIEFKEDKEAFAKQFIELAEQEAFSHLIESLPEEERNKIQLEFLAQQDNSETAGKLFQQKFSEEQTKKAFEETMENLIEDWLTSIEHTLSLEQKEKLVQLFNQAPGSV